MSTHKYVGKGGWTGKHDINGTKISDGDIMKFDDPEHNSHPHKEPYCVTWSDDEAGFECESSDNYMLACVWCKMEIIGNMRNNPELMGYTK